MDLTPRILRTAKTQALVESNKVKTAWSRNQLKSWGDIEKLLHITVPDHYKSKPFTFANVGAQLGSFCSFWEMTYEQRIQAAIDKPKEAKIRVDKKVDTFGSFTLFPEQQGCFRAIYEAFFPQFQNTSITLDKDIRKVAERAAMQDGYTGSGKMIIGCAIIAQAKKDGYFDRPENKILLHPVFVFCPKAVAELWKRTIEGFELGDLLRKRKIFVFPDTDFVTNYGRNYVDEVEDIYTGEVSYKWNPMFPAALTIIDEYHRYCNPKAKRTKCLLALGKINRENHFVCLSATWAEKVNDSFLFTVLARKKFLNVHVDESSFKYFAQIVDKRPDRANKEGCKRLRSALSENIFSIPYVKPKHKAVNIIQPCEMPAGGWEIYNTAFKRLQEVRKKMGKDELTGRFAMCQAVQVFRRTVEPLRADDIAQRTADNYHQGTFATAIGTAFKETITNIAFNLVEKHNIPRSAISIVWGGRREYKKEELFTSQELDKIFKNPDPSQLRGILSDKNLRRKIRLTLRYIQDGEEHQENYEEQGKRHDRLKELRLVGKQSDNARQVEIDKFQEGETKIVLFTIATGGIGLSFDRYKESLLPREGLFTLVYSGKEFIQLLGRLVRRASISDAIQRICVMKGTIEETHVAPILDNKLKSVAEVTNRDFELAELLDDVVANAEVQKISSMLRSIEQAEQDAENDNTIIADFHSDGELNDDDDEDDEAKIL